MSTIIFLNGCGSAGKTSLAKALQEVSGHPWVRFSMDMFIDQVNPTYVGFGEHTREGYFAFVPGTSEHGDTLSVQPGPLRSHLFGTLPVMAKVLADAGNDLLIDEVLFGDEDLLRYAHYLRDHRVYFVGVFCDLETLREREHLRGDRAIGLANDQVTRVHAGLRPYDLRLDSTHTSAMALAQDVLGFIKQTPDPRGFRGLTPPIRSRGEDCS
jgi:chloramphenicol 3-O phosphotransferase